MYWFQFSIQYHYSPEVRPPDCTTWIFSIPDLKPGWLSFFHSNVQHRSWKGPTAIFPWRLQSDIFLQHHYPFADDTPVIRLISKNEQSAFRKEVQELARWCSANNLSLNTNNAKEPIIGFLDTQMQETSYAKLGCGKQSLHLQVPRFLHPSHNHTIPPLSLKSQTLPVLSKEVRTSPHALAPRNSRV